MKIFSGLLEIFQQRLHDDIIDDINACRSGANTIPPIKNKSGGLFIISTLTGFIIFSKEYNHREIPTEVAIDTVTAFTKNESNINYFERMEALGYDNMCGLLKTTFKALRDGRLSEIQQYFWNEMSVRCFVDSFHMQTHGCELCSEDHPKSAVCLKSSLSKFKDIFKHKQQDEINTNKKKTKHTLINDEVK